MTDRFFITGTDTDVGKTEIATAILYAAQQKDLSTLAMKPVAAGCKLVKTGTQEEWKNQDAIRLHELCSLPISYQEVNPAALKAAIAPHLAARAENKNITVDRLVGLTQNLFNKKADVTVIEGAGGWRVPLNDRELMSQYVKQINIPVILVVGIRLGCLNHALLTAEAIINDRLTLTGWVANCIDPDMPAQQENIDTLKRLLPAPCLGGVPFQKDPSLQTTSSSLSLDALLNSYP